ncbi:tetratricopeptide repeat protein [Streptomyces parvus]|uniref:ATP-binding protein n=1 Tax=Streptomyces parvus TaxID=66428 RepID=A0A7K3S9Z3_9ACTN|nr:tetratricopeptide repeat protein [Streptomyces parvus]NEC23602.1 ATP-binding protein [Streptomyces parvus]
MSTENTMSGGLAGVVVQAGSIGSIALPDRPDPALNGLPPRTPAFVGREEELERVLRILDPAVGESGPRSVVISGLPGSGKTELLLQAGHRALGEPGWFPGGCLFLDLRGYDERQRLSPKRALGSLLRALGVPSDHIPPTTAERAAFYRTALAELADTGRRVLVVLDNVGNSGQLRNLLPGDTGTATLVSSRNSLADVDAALLTLRELSTEGGSRLLAEVLRLASVEDDRVVAEPEESDRIADLCGGLPLALRILGASLADTPARPLSDLRRELAESRSRLDVLQRDNSGVRAAFDLSYRRLPKDQAQLFRLLCLTPGPDFSTGTAAQLSGLDGPRARTALTGLARMHLVDQRESWDRWRLHDLLQSYAADLASPEEGHEAFRRLFIYLASRLKEAVTLFRGGTPEALGEWPDNLTFSEWLQAESTCLVHAVAGLHGAGDDLLTMAIALDLAPYLLEQHHVDDACMTLSAAVTSSRRLGEKKREAVLLTHLGLALKDLRSLKKSVRAHKAARRIAREHGDVHLEAATMNHLGLTRYEQRRFSDSLRLHRAAARLFKRSDYPQDRAGALLNAAETLLKMGRTQDSYKLSQKAERLFRRHDDAHGRAQAQGSLAVALRHDGRLGEAADLHAKAVSEARSLHRPHTLAIELANYGSALMEEGRLDEAVLAMKEALPLFQEIKDRRGEAQALGNLALVRQRQKGWSGALDMHARACELFFELNDDHFLAHELFNTCNALLRLGRHSEAVDTLETAAGLFAMTGDEPGELRCRDWLAEIVALHGAVARKGGAP